MREREEGETYIIIIKVELFISSRVLPGDLTEPAGHQVTQEDRLGSVGHQEAILAHDTNTLNLDSENNDFTR